MAKTLVEIMPPTRVDTTDPDFAGGKYKNQSVVGAQDGTPLLAAEKNQTLAFFDGIMLEGDVPYNNLTDTPQNSQYVQAIVNIASSKANDQIGINIATTAQAQAGTNDTKIMTPLKTKQAIAATVGTAVGSLSQNGYIIIPSKIGQHKLIVQWGVIVYQGSAGSAGTTVSLPVTFPNAKLKAVCSDVGSGANSTAAFIELSTITAWGKSPVTGAYVNTVIDYIALGY